MAASAQNKAAGQQAAGIQKGLDYQQGIYGTAQGNLNPYIDTGKSALYSLASLYGLPGAPGGGGGPPGAGGGAAQAFNNFTQTPAYQFPLQQGQLAASRAVNAQGGAGMGKALTQYGQGYASQGFQGYISQLAGLAGLGQSSASALGGFGNSAAANMLSGNTNIGGALGAGTLGSTGSQLQGLGGALGALGNPNNNPSTSSFGSTSAFGRAGSALAGLFNNGNNAVTPGAAPNNGFYGPTNG